MSSNAWPVKRRGRRWLIGLGLLVGLIAGLAAMATRPARWQLRLLDVHLIDHREKVAGGGAAVIVTGYVVVRVEGDADLFRLASEADTWPVVQATLCDSGRTLGAWRDPLPLERDAPAHRYVYAVLVPARGRDGELAQARGDLCLRLQAARASAWWWQPSRTLVVPLGADLREQLAAYRRRDGIVDLTLDAGCAPQLCQPE